MKSTLKITLLAALALALTAGPGLAGDIGLGVLINYKATESYNLDDAKVEFDAAMTDDFTVTYFFTDFLSLEGAIGYAKLGVDQKTEGVDAIKMSVGDLTQIPISLTARAHYRTDRFMPYVGVGILYSFNSLDVDATTKELVDNISGLAYDMDVDNDFGYHVNAGVEVLVTDSISIPVNVRYLWSSAEFKEVLDGKQLDPEDVDMNALSFGAGLKITF